MSTTHRRRAGWRKSTFSAHHNGCVEVDFTDNGVAIRDDKIADSPVIAFSFEQWAHWLDEIATDTLTNSNGVVTVTTHNNIYRVHASSAGATLNFTDHEWTAFRNGILNGEFTLSPATPV